jgi:hypothetical protein
MPPGNVVERRRFACHPLFRRQLAIYPETVFLNF